ncbi:MAG: LCP family protein [Anaerolineales bacterium]|nr:LCP family protein [Anaerolineales bacterium]
MKLSIRKVLLHTFIGVSLLIVALVIAVGFYLTIRQFTYVAKRNAWRGEGSFLLKSRTPESGAALLPPSGTASSAPTLGGTELAPPATLTPWDGAGRVTLLLLGLDYRDWDARSPASRSDTMILLTIDPLTRNAGILSIPRDLWVSIPGFKHGKINTAHYLGDAHKLPGGGPGLAVKTVEQFLGVPINYYAVVDFQAFIRFIDEIGGVKIGVPATITIDLLGSGSATKKTLQPGVQVLPGAWALAYARARHTSGGDFDRAARQQQVILAIRDRIVSFEMLPMLIEKAPALYQELAKGIRTNLTLDEVIKLAVLGSQIQPQNIRSGVINEKYVMFGNSPDNLAILLPIPDKIFVLRDEVFAFTGVLSPLALGSDQDKMKAEGARVVLINGSSSGDLAERTAQYLRSQGVNVVGVQNDSPQIANTTITDHAGRPYALKYLVGTLRISQYRIYSKIQAGAQVDVEVILGEDWAKNNNLP